MTTQKINKQFILRVTQEDGGVIDQFGEHYAAAEIEAAKRMKDGYPRLADVSTTTLACLLRKIGRSKP